VRLLAGRCSSTYPENLLSGLVIMAIGIGAVLVSGTTAANAGIPADKAGLAAGLLCASQQLGIALGVAIFSAIVTARTSTLLATRAPRDAALTAGFHRALLACAFFLLARPPAPTSPRSGPRYRNWPTSPRRRQPPRRPAVNR
jgi:MFS family permease